MNCGVYIHKKLTNGETFYVGIFKQKKRPYSKFARNKHWHSVVAKHGYNVEILCDNLTWEEAQSMEIKIISEIGRTITNDGPLVNKTIGGDGNTAPRSQESNLKRSIKQKGISKGPCSEEKKQKLSKAHKELHSKKLVTSSFIEFNKNHKRGQHKNARKVEMYTKDGIYLRTFDCVQDAKEFIKKGDVSYALKDWNTTAGGYKWK